LLTFLLYYYLVVKSITTKSLLQTYSTYVKAVLKVKNKKITFVQYLNQLNKKTIQNNLLVKIVYCKQNPNNTDSHTD